MRRRHRGDAARAQEAERQHLARVQAAEGLAPAKARLAPADETTTMWLPPFLTTGGAATDKVLVPALAGEAPQKAPLAAPGEVRVLGKGAEERSSGGSSGSATPVRSHGEEEEEQGERGHQRAAALPGSLDARVVVTPASVGGKA